MAAKKKERWALLALPRSKSPPSLLFMVIPPRHAHTHAHNQVNETVTKLFCVPGRERERVRERFRIIIFFG